jgi:hypothetical protein
VRRKKRGKEKKEREEWRISVSVRKGRAEREREREWQGSISETNIQRCYLRIFHVVNKQRGILCAREPVIVFVHAECDAGRTSKSVRVCAHILIYFLDSMSVRFRHSCLCMLDCG